MEIASIDLSSSSLRRSVKPAGRFLLSFSHFREPLVDDGLVDIADGRDFDVLHLHVMIECGFALSADSDAGYAYRVVRARQGARSQGGGRNRGAL